MTYTVSSGTLNSTIPYHTWDVTVIDTLASSYVPTTCQIPGAAAETAADRKTSKYAILSQSYLFAPVAVQIMGAINEARMNFLGDFERRITKHTDDHRESAFLSQRISTLIQRFNAVAVLGTFAPHNPRGRRLAVPEFFIF